METENQREGVVYLEKYTSRKVKEPLGGFDEHPDDGLAVWVSRYLELAVVGVRSATVAEKAALHLGRFVEFFEGSYGHDRITAMVRRDAQAWQRSLAEEGLAPSTVNNHVASLSAFTAWVDAQAPALFPAGNPAKGIKELRLPPLEPRSLSEAQVRSLKNMCDRLERFHELKGREWKKRDGGTSRRCGRTTSGTPSPIGWPRRPERTPTSWSGGLGTAPNGTSSVTPTRRRTWRPGTWRSFESRLGRGVEGRVE